MAAATCTLLGCDEPAPTPASGSYSFTVVASLGDRVPDSGVLTNDFEPFSLTERDEVGFGADLATGGEGVFVWREGRLTTLAAPGMAAPRGGTFAGYFLSNIIVNESGDVVFVQSLQPKAAIVGLNAGLYRYTRRTETLAAVMRPGDPAPGGGAFQGVGLAAHQNALGAIVFPGVIPAEVGPGQGAHVGQGLFLADADNRITALGRPGDPAPGGDTFDWFGNGWINEHGDVAFNAHPARAPCIRFTMTVPPEPSLFCAAGVFLRRADTREVIAIAPLEGPAPGGGTFHFAYTDGINNRGDVAFVAAVGPAGSGPDALGYAYGVFLYTDGQTVAVARPATPMPGGGRMYTAAEVNYNLRVNDHGDVYFAATLDTDDNHDGARDTGVYRWSRGALHLVVRTGTVLPGVGTVAQLKAPALLMSAFATAGAVVNNRGQVLFQATLTNGRTPLVIATPRS